MKRFRVWSWRRALPVALVIMGVWALAGCFYLPIPEHRVDRTQKDFTRLFRPRDGSSPIRAGITREQVVALLGPTKYISPERTKMYYFLETEYGAWVWPLCFAAYPDHKRIRMLVVEFDANSRVIGVRIDEGDPFGGDMSGYFPSNLAVRNQMISHDINPNSL